MSLYSWFRAHTSMFHFGGSTHVVLFEKKVKVSGFPEPSDHNVPVRSRLCVVE